MILWNKKNPCTYCSAVDEKVVEIHEHSSGLFGVGLLVEVSIEVAQLRFEGERIGEL